MGTLNDYRKRPHWSYSAINQFLNICSLQFAFQRVYKLEQAFTPVSLAFGSAFHRTMEWLHRERLEGRMPGKADSGERFRDCWSRQVDDTPDLRLDDDVKTDEYASQGAAMCEAMAEHCDPDEEIIGISEAFAVPLVDPRGNSLEKPLIGEFDMRVRHNGQPVIVDWKTSARRWTKDQADKSLQPTAYGYAHRHVYGEPADTRFDVAVKNKTPVIEQYRTRRDTDQYDRMVVLVTRIEDMIEAEHFLPSEQGFYCGGCPYQAACKSWHRQQAGVTVRMAA